MNDCFSAGESFQQYPIGCCWIKTSHYIRVRTALPPKADIGDHDWDVRFVPKADIVNIGNDQLALFLECVEYRPK